MTEEKENSASSPYELKVPMRAAVLTTTALILGGLVYLYYETYAMQPPYEPGYPGDAFFPRLALGFSIIWALIVLGRGFFLPQAAAAEGGEEPYLQAHWLEFVTIVVFVYLYAVLLEPIGFEIMTVALMMCLLVPRMRAESAPRGALLLGFLLSLATMIVLYLGLVPMLNIPLPLKFLPIYIF